MTTAVAAPTMTGQEIVDLTKKHTLFEWSAQSKVDPIPVRHSGDHGAGTDTRLRESVHGD